MDQDQIVEITDDSPAPPTAVQKLLKDVLDRYHTSQVELIEVIVELFQRIEKMSHELEDGTKRKRSN